MAANYWMVKQEPEAYSWADFAKERGTAWTGVRNHQARNNLRAMKAGDLVFFYHSVTEKAVVGLARVKREAYPDPTAAGEAWLAVDLVPLRQFKFPVTLEQMKNDKLLSSLPLIRQTRLSVLPVTADHARRLEKLGEMDPQ
jgi:predicted RNA-binding protein with PUA-like domain